MKSGRIVCKLNLFVQTSTITKNKLSFSIQVLEDCLNELVQVMDTGFDKIHIE